MGKVLVASAAAAVSAGLLLSCFAVVSGLPAEGARGAGALVFGEEASLLRQESQLWKRELEGVESRLGEAQCGDCWCVRGNATCPDWKPPQYSDSLIKNISSQTTAPLLALSCDPYKDTSCDTSPPLEPSSPSSVCGIRTTTANCTSNELRTFPSAEEAARSGFGVTHNGACGLCSTTQDLGVYLAKPDLTTDGKRCGAEALVSIKLGRSCFQKLGFTEGCATIWAYDARQTSHKCLGVCLANLRTPFNVPPTCELNRCLQCDEDEAGGVFKRFSGRTRRNSGILSAIQRPCSSVARLTHQACY